jgi:IclR family KDG regulon transcriptional repressor
MTRKPVDLTSSIPGGQSLDRALRILAAVASGPARAPELATALQIPRPTVIRMLAVLKHHRLVARMEDGTYSLGTWPVELAARWHEQVGLSLLVAAPLETLVTRFQETAFVCVRDGNESLCIAGRESGRAVRFGLSIGARTALHAGAFSKVLLAHAPPDVIDEVIAAGLPRFTPRTITDEAVLRSGLAKVRRDGFAESNAEADPGVVGLAAAIRAAGGETVAIGVALPTTRADASVKREIRTVLLDMAQELSQWVGPGERRYGAAS